jgi:2'-5' RNA ligase
MPRGGRRVQRPRAAPVVTPRAEQRVRLFIALEIPDDWRAAATAAAAALDAAAPRALRPVDGDLMHLTLRFLGEVDADRVPDLSAALAREVPPVDVTLRLDGAGTFGAAARTSVAWLGVGGDLEGLAALVARIEGAVVGCGLPAESRPFRAHLTLARVARTASPAERRAVAAAVTGLARPSAAPLRAREVALVRSTLGGPRPRYDVLARVG